jgi:hypothetical protein
LNAQIEAKLTAALNADDCFLNDGKESAGLINEDKDLIINFLVDILLVPGSDKKDLVEYIRFEANKYK